MLIQSGQSFRWECNPGLPFVKSHPGSGCSIEKRSDILALRYHGRRIVYTMFQVLVSNASILGFVQEPLDSLPKVDAKLAVAGYR